MKQKNTLYTVILVFATLFTSWTIPALVRKMTDDSKSYPLLYYSARLKELCILDFREMKDAFKDIHGNVYPRTQYDSLLPLMNYRQLAMNGTLPDSLDGHALDVKVLRTKQVMFRFRPVDVFSPLPEMGVLLEAMPKRGKLTLPGDYFRMDAEGITFVDAQTNRTDEVKSRKFTEALRDKGFQFPAKAFWGNPTVRKAYEEGYFCQDSKGDLYHLKMVNGRPFVKNTGISRQLDIRWFTMSEVSDKRFYGYLFGERGEMGILESTPEDGGYCFVPLDIRPVDITKDEVSILGNMLYWTVRVSDAEGMDCYGLDAATLKSLSDYHQDRKRVLWDNLAELAFPIILSPISADSGDISWYVDACSPKAWIVSIVLAMLLLACLRKKINLRKQVLLAIFVAVTGPAGLVAVLFMPFERYE